MLRVENLNIVLKKDQKSPKLVSNLSFQIEEGKIYSIIGKNGSGKSTLLKSLTNLLNPKEFEFNGKIKWNSSNLLDLNCKELLQIRRNDVKYIFQDAIGCFDPIKKIEYYFKKFTDKKIDECFAKLDLDKYDTIKNLYPNQLSNGMAQRISLALALLSNPKLLILDEPTSALDFLSAKLIFENLKSFVSKKDKSVLLVTQDFSFAEKISDKIAFMNEGCLSEFYPAEKIYDIKTDKYIGSIIAAYRKLK
ncbi:MAG: ABC transporter ATP-binding protein [Melioribacteraceae bacterium]|nr:ABC transporter ATP-binding protein [Melioribacteraceae bacterium]